MGVFQALCAVCECVVGRGFTSQCLDIGAHDWAAVIGGRDPDSV